MTDLDRGLIWTLCISSLTVTLILAGWIVGSYVLHRSPKDGVRRRGISFLWVCVFLLLAVWMLRYAVNYYLMRCPVSDEDRILDGWEQIFNSFLHALQTFSMDEGYTEYIRSGKDMMGMLTNGNTAAVRFYGIYASVLNVAAPIAGGAIVFEILTSFFPHVRLFFGSLSRRRHLYFFSELNLRSLTLAKSVIASYDPKAMIVFANADKESDGEDLSDLMDSAKNISAVCIKTDFTHLRFRLRGQRMFYFMSSTELENINLLLAMAANDDRMMLRGAKVYLFADASLYECVEEQLTCILKEKGFVSADMPWILPVCIYQNLVFNLLTQMPLTEPLIPDRRDNAPLSLRLTVLGAGSIGTELLLGAYWCGQMLGCTLCIEVISKETEEEFWQKLDSVNPDLQKSMQENNPILQINGRGDMAKPYCRLHYRQADLEEESLRSLLDAEPAEGSFSLLDTHYFAVALGSDERNVRAANVIRQECGRRHLDDLYAHRNDSGTVPVPRTLIAYAVYDAALCAVLNRDALQSSAWQGSNDIYLYAFGSMEHEYSVENVMMPEVTADAEQQHRKYMMQQEHQPALRKDKIYYSYYDLWASLARVRHEKYRQFSAGLRMPSVFVPDAPYTWEQTDAAYTSLVISPKNLLQPYDPEPYREMFVDGAVPEDGAARKRLLDALAWLEHRRWVAFLRSRGYQTTDAMELFRGRTGSHKDLRLRLHPCLVECDRNGIHADLRADIEACGGDPEKLAAFDRLDMLTYELHLKNSPADPSTDLDSDFKIYDYPNNGLEKPKH